MPKITIKECSGEKVFHKNNPITLEQIQNFEVNERFAEKLKRQYYRQAFALYETLDNKYYLYDIANGTLGKITTEDYIKLKNFGGFSNRVANEQHILDMINSLSSNYGIYTEVHDNEMENT